MISLRNPCFLNEILTRHVYFGMHHGGPPPCVAKITSAICSDCEDSHAHVFAKHEPDEGDPILIGADALLALFGDVPSPKN